MNPLDPARALRGRAAIFLLAAVLYGVVFVIREAFGTPADGLTFLYLLPICLLAIDRGVRAGVAAGGSPGAGGRVGPDGLSALTALAYVDPRGRLRRGRRAVRRHGPARPPGE